MLFREIIAVYFENHTKHYSVGRMQKAKILKQVVCIPLCFKWLSDGETELNQARQVSQERAAEAVMAA
jgi:hypothetical protein